MMVAKIMGRLDFFINSGDDKLSVSTRDKLVAGFVLLLILLVTLISYRVLLNRGFTDADDYLEVHRAVVTDIPNPSQIFLTAHYGNRYRPINRLLTAMTTHYGDANAEPFLIRNLLFHLFSVALVFGISMTIMNDLWIATLATCLFAFHPANVNVISVAVFTHTLGTMMILLAILILMEHKTRRLNCNWWILVIVGLLLATATFSNEMYLWVIPIYALFLLWQFVQRKRLVFLAVAMMMLLTLCGYFILRQSVVQEGSVTAVGRYGLQPLSQITRNVAMFAIGSGNALDYLLFFNPVDKTVPTRLAELVTPGFSISLFSTLLVFGFTFWGVLILFIKKPRYEVTRFTLVFIMLFILSISVVSVGTLASDTYLYISTPFLAIAQGLILFDLLKNISPHWHYKKVIQGLIVLFAVAVILVRAIGVDYRNSILDDKANRISYLQSELWRATAGFVGDRIAFISPCAPPHGYSIYGGRGMVLIEGSETGFVQLTLNSSRITAGRSNLELLGAGKVKDSATLLNLVVDNQGKMYRLHELSNPVTICK